MEHALSETPTTPEETVRFWLNELDAAKHREKDFRKDGQRILDIYSAKNNADTPFNILFSNTETLLPALYSAQPRPVVTRRFRDADPIGRAAAQAGQRGLEFLVDTNLEGYETFDEAMRAVTIDGLLPGRGWTCVRYHAAFLESPDDTTGQDDGATTPYLQTELVCLETMSWNKVYHGFARKWSVVPWVAYEMQVDRAEAMRLFGAEIASTLRYHADDEQTDKEHENHEQTDTIREGSRRADDQGEKLTALVYQIWDKDGGRKIRYLSPNMKEKFLKVEDDPLGLTGFFNCPRPMTFIEKSNDLFPTALYLIYENQAKELNRLTRRLNRVIEAVKVRGCYAGDLSHDLSEMMKGDDNELVPAGTSSSLAFEKGLQNSIWFMPIQELIVVAEKLYQAREACKRVIYEITGISDIIRGSTVASETATAQTLKTQWGTLRLKRLQKEVQRYSRDLLRMMLEVAATKFNEETWAKMTGLPFTTTAQREQLTMLATASQMSGQPLDPSVQQGLSAPQWAQVLTLLQDDSLRAYRVDIETNSTLEPEAAEDHKEITALMTAMGQYLNGVGPLVAKGVMPFQAAQSMLLAIARRFRFGTEVEEEIQQMKAPPPEDDGQAGESAKLQAEQQRAQADLQAKVQESAAERQQQAMIETAKHQREVEAEQHKIQMEQMRLAHETTIKQMEVEAAARLEKQKSQWDYNTQIAIARLEAQTQIAVAEIAAQATKASSARTAQEVA